MEVLTVQKATAESPVAVASAMEMHASGASPRSSFGKFLCQHAQETISSTQAVSFLMGLS